MKIRYIYILLWAAAVAGMPACVPNKGTQNKGIPSLDETYLPTDTKPFGSYVAKHLLQSMYPNLIIENRRETIEEARRKSYDTGAVYITIAESFYTSEEDVTALKGFVRAGNDMFVAAAAFDDNLMDEINCSVETNSNFQDALKVPMVKTSVNLHANYYADTNTYSYFYRPFVNHFSILPKGEAVVLGYNDAGKPNFVVVFLGSGRLFLHCEPRAFSNYFLLQKNNHQYLNHAMTFTKRNPEKITWNEYYPNVRYPRSSNKSDKGSLFDGLKGGLLIAFWLMLAMIVLYIIDGTKRRQRIIPIRKPNVNTTVTFAETVGLLYLQKKDNKNIADKMIAYFNEFVRNQYFLNTNHPNSDFITTLSRKSGVPLDKVEALYKTIAHAQFNNVIDDFQLLSLNQQIQNFYKYRN